MWAKNRDASVGSAGSQPPAAAESACECVARIHSCLVKNGGAVHGLSLDSNDCDAHVW